MDFSKDRYLLDKFFELCFSVSWLTDVEDLIWTKIYTSDVITDEYNNFADIYTLKGQVSKKVKQIEEILTTKSRKPAIYVSDFSHPEDAGDILSKKFGYVKSYTDAFMVLDNSYSLPDWEEMVNVIQIRSNSFLLDELEKVTKLSYGGEKSFDNPYGGIPMDEYIIATRKAIENDPNSNKIEGYLASKGKEYIACSLLIHDDKVGYIAGVGSIPKVRGQGFGKLVSHYAAKRSKHLGCETTFLTTEKGSRNEEFYRRIGYETKFNGTCYIKSE